MATGVASTILEVREVGLAALMRGLAEHHAGVYGVLAVAVMMMLGFGIDFLVAAVRRCRTRGDVHRVDALAHKDVAAH
jgi:hypothetical protein